MSARFATLSAGVSAGCLMGSSVVPGMNPARQGSCDHNVSLMLLMCVGYVVHSLHDRFVWGARPRPQHITFLVGCVPKGFQRARFEDWRGGVCVRRQSLVDRWGIGLQRLSVEACQVCDWKIVVCEILCLVVSRLCVAPGCLLTFGIRTAAFSMEACQECDWSTAVCEIMSHTVCLGDCSV